MNKDATLAELFRTQALSETGPLLSKSDVERVKQTAADDTVDEHLDALVTPSMDKLLDVPLTDIFIGAWRKVKTVRTYATPEKVASGKTYKVPLVKHAIESLHRPKLELILKGAQIFEVGLDVAVRLSIEGAVLSIKKGRIMKISLSRCLAEGEIKIGERTIAKRKSSTYILPSAIDLEDGIVIPPP